MKIFFIYIAIIILLVIIINIYYKAREDKNFSYVKIENRTYYFNEINHIEFNKLFNTHIVILPYDLYAVGIIDNNLYLTDDRYKYSKQNTSQFPYLQTFITYLYTHIYPHLNTNKIHFIYSVCDGHGERIKVDNKFEYYEADMYEFNNVRKNINKNKDGKFPILHKNKYILTNSKLKNDIYAKAIPDPYFTISNGHVDLIKDMKNIRNIIPWNQKISKAIWRGSLYNGTKYNFINPIPYDMNQREYFYKLYSGGVLKNVNYSKNNTTKEEMCRYKYLIDIDGFSNTWDATIWKLMSGCVLLKVDGVWEQWYYNKLHEYIHYVPIKDDFSDLNEKIEWCINNDYKCKEISDNAYNFVLNELTFEKAQDYTINVFKKYIL